MTTKTSNLTDLREHLMATLADLRNRDKPMDVDRARAVAQVAGVLIESAKVEVDFLRVTGSTKADFITSDTVAIERGISHQGGHIERTAGVTRHSMGA